MQTQGNLGWRKLGKPVQIHDQPTIEADRRKLYKLKNLAAVALGLSKSQIAVLNSLISYFQEPIAGRLLVWPSNQSLMTATGYSERAVRLAIRQLISIGIIQPKDSANGKRFADRSPTKQILDAFGFDLAPLLLREKEFKDSVLEIEARKEMQSRQLDDITICRRQVQEFLRAFGELDASIDMSTLQSAFDQMVERTPRRSLNRFPGPLLAEWSALLKVTEHQYHTAFAGNDCRHKENNNDIPEQSCSNGQGEMVRGETVSLPDLIAACPDAIEQAGAVRREGDLIQAASVLRGVYGTHRTAWEEACDDLGRPRAAVLFFYLLQLYEDDQRGRRTINNFGGLFRSWARKVAAGEVDLTKEIHAMRRKRVH